MEHQQLTAAGDARGGYGSISPVKQLKRLMSPHQRSPRHEYHPIGDLAEPESASLMTNVRFLTDSGKRFHRDRISRYLDHSAFGALVDVVMAGVSIVFAAAYITNTYIPRNVLPIWLWVVEIVCAVFFSIDFAFRGLYLSDHRVDFVLSLPGLAALGSILPVLPTSFFLEYHTLWYGSSNWRFVYPLRFIKCYVDLKAVLSRCQPRLSPVRQLALLCYLQLIFIIAGAAGVIQIAETSDGSLSSPEYGEWTFFNAFFNSVLVFVTIQTPPADNTLAKCAVGVLVILLILIVPYQVMRVLDMGSNFSPYEHTVFKPTRRSRHVVLCGDLTPSRIDLFFREVFHDDHDQADITVVVLSEEEPAPSMRALLMDPFFDKRVRIVLGSMLDADDSRRAAVSSADAVFVLARRLPSEEDHAKSDHRTLLRVLAAHRTMPLGVEVDKVPSLCSVTAPRIFAQLHLSQHRRLLRDLRGVRENALCFSEVIHSLLAQNCVCPGFSTFIYSLTATSSYDDEDAEAMDDGTATWEARYRRGSSHEVYSVQLPPAEVVKGRSFAEVASLAYAHCGSVIVFAVVLPSDADDKQSARILLNPGDSFVCQGGETVFVIAQDRRGADAVTKLQAGHDMAPEWSSGSHQRHLSTGSSSSLPLVSVSVLPASDKPYEETTQVVVQPTAVRDDKHNEETTQVVVQPTAVRVAIQPPKPGRRRSRFVNWQMRLQGQYPGSPDSTDSSHSHPHPETDDEDDSRTQSSHLSPLHEHQHRHHHHRHRTVESATISNVREIRSSNSHAAPIVVCVLSSSTFPNNLEYLVGPLRVTTLRVHRPIVVLTRTLPDEEEFAGFRRFRDVYFIEGDPFQRSALRRAGVDRAFRIVIMGGEGEVAAEAGAASELLEDASCIALHKTITSFVGPTGAPRIVTELVNRVNVHFISQNLAASQWFPPSESEESLAFASSTILARDFYLSPSFAAGLTYSSSLCDSLLINQFFNPRITSILRAFIFASWKEDERSAEVEDDNEDEIDDNGSETRSVGQSPTTTPVGYQQHQLQRCSLFAVEVPLDFIGKPFAFVFHYLLSSDGILVLGLYRCRPDPLLSGFAAVPGPAPRARIQVDESERSVPFGYVSVNPRSTERVTGNDLLYVLADKQPCWA